MHRCATPRTSDSRTPGPTDRPPQPRPAASSLWRRGACCLVSLLLAGCTGSSSPPVAEPPPAAPAADPPPPTSQADAVAPGPAVPSPSDLAIDGSAPAPPPVAEPADPADRPPRPDRPPAPPDPARQAESRERILAITTAGPLLIELTMTIDGSPYPEPMRRLVDQAYDLADANGDGQRTWEEFVELPFVRYGGFGNLAFNTEAEKRQLLEQYDAVRNGRVDREELPRFLTRNRGQSGAFHFRSSNRDRYRNRSDSPLRLMLDKDRNGRLDAQEIENAAALLAALDSDQDDILRRDETRPVVLDDAMGGMAGPLTQTVTGQTESAHHLQAREAGSSYWSRVEFLLAEMYAFRREVTADHFRLDPGLFRALDANVDGVLQARELPALLTVQPHLRLRFAFAENPRDSHLSLEEASPALPNARLQVLGPTRAVVQTDAIGITIFLNDLAISIEQQTAQAFAGLDANRDGYLEQDELPEQGLGAAFAEIDLDGDEKIYQGEFRDFLGQQPLAANTQLLARAGEGEDAVFAWLDADQDGRLGARELRQSADRLRQLDLDQDGELGVDDFPESYLLGIVRCPQEQDDQAFVMAINAAYAADAARQLPAWMANMDVNRDGVLTPREFLGSRSQFQQLDRNQDGFLELAECLAESQAE